MTDPIDRTGLRPRFWERFDLTDLPKHEWEALCDGCAKCCLIKLEDIDTGEVEYTDVACRLLDRGTCRCTNYALRRQLVDGCLAITPESLERIGHWLPLTCAYRRLWEGRGLPAWHPLLTGDADSPHAAGISLRGRMAAEEAVDEDDLEEHIVEGLH